MSTLKVNKLRDTAGSADAIVLDPNGGAVLAGVTTVTSVKVGAAVTISESGIEASGIGITCANINGGQVGGRRNLVINGAMTIAQRSSSVTTSSGIAAVDRMSLSYSGTDESPGQAQSVVISGTTPYTEGLRKAYYVINGNQTGGAGATDYMHAVYTFEDQDLAQSGWNHKSSSSFVTLSYWVKSSVAQNFYLYLQSDNGSQYRYTMETGSLTANTWTKVTKTIPGNSNIVLNNDTGAGMYIVFSLFDGTDRTGTRPLNAWAALDNTSRTPDQQQTWYTTNDATFEITGLQLEVGSQATPFEHRTQGENLQLCQRYFQKVAYATGSGGSDSGNFAAVTARFATPMRSAPTITVSGVLNAQGDNALNSTQSSTNAGQSNYSSTENMYVTYVSNFSNVVQGRCYFLGVIANNSNQFLADAEI